MLICLAKSLKLSKVLSVGLLVEMIKIASSMIMPYFGNCFPLD